MGRGGGRQYSPADAMTFWFYFEFEFVLTADRLNELLYFLFGCIGFLFDDSFTIHVSMDYLHQKMTVIGRISVVFLTFFRTKFSFSDKSSDFSSYFWTFLIFVKK